MSPAEESVSQSSREGGGADTAPAEVVDLGERKERVLHTRVPESLDRHIKWRAQNLGMSVSTVVRHVLLNTFGLVEDIVTDSTNIARSIAGAEVIQPSGRARMRGSSASDGAPGTTEILGWQEAILNVNAVCDRCNAILRKGDRAAIGVCERPGRRAFMCRQCLGSPAAPRRGGGQAKRRVR